MSFVDIVTLLLAIAILACSGLTVYYLRRADRARNAPKSIATPSISLNASVDEVAKIAAKIEKTRREAHIAR
ncbi:hypothetical protein ACFXG4_03845 [Nocardia sp. NPDC059246]|uniref:hypothetical protein n=1 Tax=unclassified Nocardia TaxID=2637762 RepID=UPI003699F096